MHLRNFSSEEEAIKLANASDYASQSPISAFFVPYLSSQGLAASVYSNDIEEAMRIAKRIDSGAVHINGMTVVRTQVVAGKVDK